MEKKYKPATLTTLQDDIENLHKEVKKLNNRIDCLIDELYHKFCIEIVEWKGGDNG